MEAVLALTLDDQRTALNAAYVVLLVWPLILTGPIAFFRRRNLKSRLAFICLGYLICAGVFFLVGQGDAHSGWIHTAATISTDRLVAFMIKHTLARTVVSMILAVLPVVWLYRLLATTSAVK
jgi:uncharacterized membrane protein (UPF0136 family)